jgi:hypothetical protein
MQELGSSSPVTKSFTVKGFLISLGIAIAAAALGLALLGIPGALIFTLLLPIVSLFLSNTSIHADAAWPIAILITLLWPVSFPLGYLAAWGLFANRKRSFKWLVLVAITLLWALALTFYYAWTAPKA